MPHAASLHCTKSKTQIKMNDGPQGFRDGANPGTSTAWPSAMTVGATWDAALVRAWGVAMGEVRFVDGHYIFFNGLV
jgi:beta-glucosidase-like glycosyl hydrolase